MIKRMPIHCNPKVYEDYFCNLADYGIPVFIGSRSQHSHGICSFFSGLNRMCVVMAECWW